MTGDSTDWADDEDATLPPPETVTDKAAAVAATGSEPDRKVSPEPINLIVAGTGDLDVTAVSRTDEGYQGPQAGTAGRVAAATTAADGRPEVKLHYPELTSAPGAWLVVAPLAGRLATVHRGTGTVRVTFEPEATSVDARLRTAATRLSAVLNAARPSHEHYPVEHDGAGVFTTGLTTFDLVGVDHEDRLSVVLSVATTPATTRQAVRRRFAAVEAVSEVVYESGTEPSRAIPPDNLRAAAEAAAELVRGDWAYEWLPAPGTFARIPGEAKLALGTGEPNARTFDDTQYAECLALIEATLDRVSGPEARSPDRPAGDGPDREVP